MKTIPNGDHSAFDILRLARELDVPGILIARGRKYETRSYAVMLDNGEILPWHISALPAEHYAGA